MKKIQYLAIFATVSVFQFCAQTYNVVRMRNDPYLQSTKYSLATTHELEGPGNYFTNYSKGKRNLRVDYSREIKDNKVIKEEILLSVQLYDDDPQIDNKLVLLVDNKPVQLSEIVWNTGSKTESGTTTRTQHGAFTNQYGQMQSGPHQVTSSYSHSYKTAAYAFTPPDPLKAMLQNAVNTSVRIYIGAEVATAVFDERSINAVRRFYANQADEMAND